MGNSDYYRSGPRQAPISAQKDAVPASPGVCCPLGHARVLEKYFVLFLDFVGKYIEYFDVLCGGDMICVVWIVPLEETRDLPEKNLGVYLFFDRTG